MQTFKKIAAAGLCVVVCGATSPAWCKNTESLWAANTNDETVVEFSPGELKSSGTPTPTLIEGTPLNDVEGVTFDEFQNLWVTTYENRVLQFTPPQLRNLATVPNPTPNATISSTTFQGLDGCTLDSHGNLWIVDYGANGFHELTEMQLVAGSNPDITPAITITSSSLDAPNFDAFDRHGNLWISNEDNAEVVEFSASQLGSSGAKAANIVLSGSSLDAPVQMGFDTKGDLWVANFGNDTVVMFAKKDLKASGSPTPKVTLSVLDGPFGLAFDRNKNLWISNIYDGDLFKFSSKQYKKSGAPTPAVTLTGVLSGSYEMIFGPNY